MQFSIVFTLLALSFSIPYISQASRVAKFQVCPTFCNCDRFDGLNRANCSSRRLISANVGVPTAVEILDLSHNDITILDKNCFQNFFFLITLDLSHNAIHTIYYDTFNQMHKIDSIDLSHNRLEYVDERIIETNRKLVRLDLSDNKFMSLQNKPLLRSATLRYLNLRNTQISHIYAKLFDALTNLYELDVSANLMIALNMDAFRGLKRLTYLNLNANRWNCDAGLLNTVKLLQGLGTIVRLIDCNAVAGSDVAAVAETTEATTERKEVGTKSKTLLAIMATMSTITAKKNERFERLQMFDGVTNENFDTLPIAGNGEKALTEANELGNMVDAKRESVEDEEAKYNAGSNIDNIWHSISFDELYDDEAEQGDAEPNEYEGQSHKLKCKTSCDELCFQFTRCLEDKVNIEKKMAGTYTINDLNFVFVMGIALGITFVVCIISCVMCIKRCCEASKKPSTIEYHITENAIAHRARPLPPQPLIATQTPRTRISRRRRHMSPNASDTTNTSNQRNALVRHDYAISQSRDNFFSRLFGRPARHQYYRTINQNTATLIRRLSRSNLFNNRFSQHFAAETREHERAGATVADTPTAPSSPENEGAADEQFYNEIFIDSEVFATPEEPAAIEIRNRPETPPPSYGDVVVNVRKT